MASNAVLCSNHYGLDDVALLDDSAGCRIFNGAYDDVSDVCILTACSTQDADAKE